MNNSNNPKDVHGEERTKVSRKMGLRDRRIGGKLSNEENDKIAAAAEAMICKLFNKPYRRGSTGPDGGYDFKLGNYTVDVKCIAPRKSGHLIKPPHQAYCGIYIVVGGADIESLKVLGWETGDKLKHADMKDFGYGLQPAIHTSELRGINELLRWRKCQHENQD